ncbi:hypothetical protein HPULCUR_001360 [Helicostylum pulchrum]|uniref:Uncharacterized protein n=1 Tax=Helicostylum pulchrum TaxID=562976 RepID=A0ABP9XP29_9FUNG
MLSEQDNLKAWPSDVTSKFNVFEFYHKILWASQQCEEEQVVPIKKKGCRVTFSLEPPIIHEYEPEFTNTNKTCIHYYQSFKRKFHQVKKEQEKYFYPTIEDDEMYYQNRRLMKTRSLSDFKPIPNQLYHPNNHELTRSTYSLYDIPHYDDDPPPSYIEYHNYNRNDDDDDDDQGENRLKNTSLLGGNIKIKKAAFFKRTLRKLKSSPRLIQRNN